MDATDLPAVARMFQRIFRGKDEEAEPDLVNYLGALVFGSPCYERSVGSLVFAEADSSISSAILTVPLTFVACGRIVIGRLLCAYMTQDQRTSGGAGALSLTLRAPQQAFSFTDTASPSSLRQLQALGSVTIPLQNLGWTRTFRPLGAAVDRASRRFMPGSRGAVARIARPLDDMLRARKPRIVAAEPPRDILVAPMTTEHFLDEAPAFVAHYAIHPLWSHAELSWLLDMARQNKRLGNLAIMAVTDGAKGSIGCFVYYGDGTRVARVLNILAMQGREVDVLDAMFRTFDQRGFLEARGRTQPTFAEGLALQPMLTLHHEGFACVVSRYPDVVDAVRRGDIYIGGLAGEGWSRLMSDFP